MDKTRKTHNEIETCFSCGLYHENVEAKGIWHCPNALCMGCGGAWFRQTLDSYKECEDGSQNHKVNNNEWLDKGIVYNHENKIDRDIFFIPEEQEKDDEKCECKSRQLKKIIAKNAYKKIKNAISEVEESKEICISANWDECITVDDEMFNGEELSEQ